MNDFDRLKTQAEEQNASFPQYKKHWDGWVVGTVRKKIKTKLGLAFLAGDKVLVKPEIRDLSAVSFSRKKVKLSLTCYSWRNRCDTSIWATDVDVDLSAFAVTTEF